MAEIINAITALMWPIIAAVMLWRTYPLLKMIFSSRNFTVEIGGAKLSVQDATQLLSARVNDVQQKIVELDQNAGPPRLNEVTRNIEKKNFPLMVLWCDDNPSNNVIEVQQMREYGFRVISTTSTDDALDHVNNVRPNIVISDMGRYENGRHQRTAGMLLYSKLKEKGIELPFIIYASSSAVEKYQKIAAEEGVTAMTSSPVELLGVVRGIEKELEI